MSLWLSAAIDQAVSHVGRIDRELRDAGIEEFPHITNRQAWQTTPDGVWTGGFWAGLLWLAYEQTGDQSTLERAAHFTNRLLPQAQASHNHDLGFMFMPSAVKGWSLIGEPLYREAAVAAAVSLGGQFNTAGGFIPGWGFFGGDDWSGAVLIDTLMNLPLLLWAVQQGADRRLADVARSHAATSLGHQLRADGSVFHVFHFDPATGQPVRGDTYQGLGPDSSWARGQAWAITGLAMLAKMTGQPLYLRACERVAANFLRRLPESRIAPWDFDAEGPGTPRDSSATAIASYGFSTLYEVTGDPRHMAAAATLLAALVVTCANRTDSGGLLLHATADLPHGFGIDESTMYGDYYYLKALVAVQRTHRETGHPIVER
jgi:unsaturated chondroitin disaccharide hydrolase